MGITKDMAIQMRNALKGNKNLPLRIMMMDSILIIDESSAFQYTKWDDTNGILYSWRLVNPAEHPNAISDKMEAVSVIATPYEYIGFMQAVVPLENMDDVFNSMESEGVTFNDAQFKETIKYTFKELMHPGRWRLSPSDVNAIHGAEVMNDKDNYYQGKFTEPFKETRPKAELNEWINKKIEAGEDPTKDKVPLNTRVTAPVNPEP